MKRFLSLILSVALMFGSCSPLANCANSVQGGENKIVQVGENKKLIYISNDKIPIFMSLIAFKHEGDVMDKKLGKSIMTLYGLNVWVASMLIQRKIAQKIESNPRMSENKKKAARIATMLAATPISRIAYSVPGKISGYLQKNKNKIVDVRCVANWDEYNDAKNGLKKWKSIYPELETDYYATYWPFKYQEDPISGLYATLSAISPEGFISPRFWALTESLPSEPNILAINARFTELGNGIVIVSETYEHGTYIKVYRQGDRCEMNVIDNGRLPLKSISESGIEMAITSEKALTAEDFHDTALLDQLA